MFHDIPQSIKERMAYLEAVDARDRIDGTPRLMRLRQIPPETGKFLALLAASAPLGALLEIGTSAGYSSLWLSLACRLRNQKLTTFEVLPEKARLAQETFTAARVESLIEIVQDDARRLLASYYQVAFCFLDAEKDIHQSCYDLVIPNLVPGGLLVADNVISHQAELQSFLRYASEDPRLDALVVPLGKGLLLCRKL